MVPSSSKYTLRVDIEMNEAVYELLQLLAKKDRISVKKYIATSLYLKMEGDIDDRFGWADDPRKIKHFATLRTVFKRGS